MPTASLAAAPARLLIGNHDGSFWRAGRQPGFGDIVGAFHPVEVLEGSRQALLEQLLRKRHFRSVQDLMLRIVSDLAAPLE